MRLDLNTKPRAEIRSNDVDSIVQIQNEGVGPWVVTSAGEVTFEVFFNEEVQLTKLSFLITGFLETIDVSFYTLGILMSSTVSRKKIHKNDILLASNLS